MSAAQAVAWTAGGLGELADDLADLQAAHGAVQVDGEQLGELVARLLGVMEHLAADLHAAEAEVTPRRPGRPALQLLQGGRP